jgi:Uma2 family endonuclease
MTLLSPTHRHRRRPRLYRIEGEPYELLNGQIVRKDRGAAGEDSMTQGERHMWVVMRLVNLNPQLQRQGCHLRPQLALALPPFSEPEPDGAIVAGTEDDYLRRTPGAKDTTCVLEVADSSLRLDRLRKLRIYAKANVPMYVIVNLRDSVLEVYTDPLKTPGRYAQARTLRRNEAISFPTPRKAVVVPVRRLLP